MLPENQPAFAFEKEWNENPLNKKLLSVPSAAEPYLKMQLIRYGFRISLEYLRNEIIITYCNKISVKATSLQLPVGGATIKP